MHALCKWDESQKHACCLSRSWITNHASHASLVASRFPLRRQFDNLLRHLFLVTITSVAVLLALIVIMDGL